MKRIAVLFLTALVLCTTQAKAEVTVKDYTKIKAAGGDDWEALIVYIVGVEAGINRSNAYLELNDKPPMHCLPKSLHTKC